MPRFKTIGRNLDNQFGDDINANFARADADLTSISQTVTANELDIEQKLADHKASTTAHAAEKITYSGKVTGATNVKQAIEKVDDRVSNIVASAGQSNTEIVDARPSVDGTANPTLKARLDKMEQQQVEQSKQSATLKHGLNVVQTSQVSPLDVTINGRTLVNLLGVLGRTATSATVQLDQTKYYVIVNEDMTNVTVDGVSQAVPHKFTGKTSVTLAWASGKVALYEVTSGDYAKIGIDPEYSGSKILNVFPYVDSVQHLCGVAIQKSGKNLLPPFTEWTRHNNTQIDEPYKITHTASAANEYDSVDVLIKSGETYSLACTVTGNGKYTLEWRDANKAYISNTPAVSSGTLTSTAPINAAYARITFSSQSAGVIVYSNPTFNLGSTATTFEPQNNDYIFVDPSVKLASSLDGSIKDQLYQRDGRWYVLKRFEKDVVLGGSLNWSFVDDYSGFKRVSTNYSFISYIASSLLMSKYSGYLIKRQAGGTPTSGDICDGNGSNYLWITISDTDSGWGETYTPTSDEIKAYFNGWKAKTVDGNGKPTAWQSLVDGTDAPTQTLAYVSANMAPGFTPYKLTYRLANAQEIDVTDKVEGAISLHAGLNQIDVSSGVVVREKVTPYFASGMYRINDAQFIQSLLKYRLNNFVRIYKNGIDDTKNWTIGNAIGGYPNGGNYRAYTAQIDPTAEYTVTYLALDKYSLTTNVDSVTGTYQTNIVTSLNKTIQDVADVKTQVSVHVRSIAELYKRVKALGG